MAVHATWKSKMECHTSVPGTDIVVIVMGSQPLPRFQLARRSGGHLDPPSGRVIPAPAHPAPVTALVARGATRLESHNHVPAIKHPAMEAAKLDTP